MLKPRQIFTSNWPDRNNRVMEFFQRAHREAEGVPGRWLHDEFIFDVPGWAAPILLNGWRSSLSVSWLWSPSFSELDSSEARFEKAWLLLALKK